MIRFRIIAGTHEQAKELAHKTKMAPWEWAYVHSREGLLGLDGGVLIMTGTWRDRKDWVELVETAETRRMRILYDQ